MENDEQYGFMFLIVALQFADRWTGEICFTWLQLGLAVCYIIAINSRRNLRLGFAYYLYLYVY